jgi:hypothetical protein
MGKLYGTECLTCDATLTEASTQDWGGEAGHCDECCEYQADTVGSELWESRRLDYLEEANEAYRTDN